MVAFTTNERYLSLFFYRKVIHTPMGTLITAAAMIDDIFSLVLLALTTAINKSETGAIESNEPIGWTIARPILFSFLVVGVGTLVAWLLQLGLARPLTRTMVTRVKTKLGSERSKIAFLLIMLGFSFIWSISAAFSGASYLLGSFVAGLSFSSLPESRRLWEEHVTPIQSWLVAVFFGTIGFLIPVNILFDPWALLYGALIYTAISFLAKFLTGLLTSPFKFVTV
jgi:Kef-type K+ transport system membrane component KefB